MAEERVQRRPAAILAADVVGYSRLMGGNETGTLAALRAHRKELVDSRIAEHEGRIVKLTGDGMLVEFSSVVNAVACATEIQRKMRERNTDVPSPRCHLRWYLEGAQQGTHGGSLVAVQRLLQRKREERRVGQNPANQLQAQRAEGRV